MYVYLWRQTDLGIDVTIADHLWKGNERFTIAELPFDAYNIKWKSKYYFLYNAPVDGPLQIPRNVEFSIQSPSMRYPLSVCFGD